MGILYRKSYVPLSGLRRGTGLFLFGDIAALRLDGQRLKEMGIFMDTIIQELISYDRQAKEIIEEAVRAREQAERELPQAEKRLYDDFVKRAKDRVSRIGEHVQSSRQSDIARMEEIYRLALEQLENSYSANRERWRQELFERCIQQEP